MITTPHHVWLPIGTKSSLGHVCIWCDQNVGQEFIAWTWHLQTKNGSVHYIFEFVDAAMATLFALRWL